MENKNWSKDKIKSTIDIFYNNIFYSIIVCPPFETLLPSSLSAVF